MKKLLLLNISLFFVFLNAPSQTPNFCNAWSLSNGGQIFSTAIDINNNIYVAGHIYVNTLIGNDSLITNSNTVFLAKYSSSGTPVWAKCTWGGGQGMAFSIDTDNSGNVYITGDNASDTTFFDSTHFITSMDKSFLTKYDSTGNVLWVKGFKVLGNMESREVSIDSAGNAFVTGWFQADTAYFDGLWITNSDYLDRETFVAKYDSAGNAIWVISVRGHEVEQCESIKVDGSGNAYICGQSGSDTLISGNDTLFGTNGFMFVIKYDANGNTLWARNIADTVNIQVYKITTDNSGNVYVAGDVSPGTLIFGNDTLINTGTKTNSLLLKYDSGGNEAWARKSNVIGSLSGGATASSVCTDPQNNAYFTGCFANNSIIFDNDTLINNGFFDIFFVKYDSTGNVLWTKGVGGANLDQAWTVSLDNQQNIYIAGDFRNDTLNFDGISLYGMTHSICYVAKICNTTGIAEKIIPESFNIFPNPANTYVIIDLSNMFDKGTIEIINMLGGNVLHERFYNSKKQINLNSISSGVYLVKISDDKQEYYEKLIVNHE